MSSAISGAFTWSLIANILLIIIWSIIGMGMSNSTFGLVVTIGSIVLLILASYVSISNHVFPQTYLGLFMILSLLCVLYISCTLLFCYVIDDNLNDTLVVLFRVHSVQQLLLLFSIFFSIN